MVMRRKPIKKLGAHELYASSEYRVQHINFYYWISLKHKAWLPFRLLAMKTSTNPKAVPEAIWASSLKIRVKIETQVQFLERLTWQTSLCHVIWFSKVCFSLAFYRWILVFFPWNLRLEFTFHLRKPKFISLPVSPQQIKVSFGLTCFYCKCLKANQSVLP